MNILARNVGFSLRPLMGMRGMAIGSGAGTKEASVPPEAQAVSDANLEEAEKTMKKRLRQMDADRPERMHPEPDPTSTAVPGLTSEFQAEHDSYNSKKGAKPPKTNVGNYTSTPPKPAPEAMMDKAKEFVKESVNTLTHGVNNAGQPEVAEKLKQS